MDRRPALLLLLLLAAAGLLQVARADARDGPDVEVEDAEAGHEEEEERAGLLLELSGKDVEAQVYRSSFAWAVLLTAPPEVCPQCGGYEAILEGQALDPKGLVRLAKVDATLPENKDMVMTGGQMGLPQLRLYVAPGQRNAYKKNAFFREFAVYTGQQSSRGVKRFINEALKEGSPLKELKSGGDVLSEIAAFTETGQAAVVALSSSSSASTSLTAALARVLETSGMTVAQVSSVDLESDVGKAIAAAVGGGVSELPDVALWDPASKSWTTLGSAEVKKATLQDLVAFVETVVPVERTLGGAEDAASAEADAKSQEEQKRAMDKRRLGIIDSSQDWENTVTKVKMPSIVAVRRPGVEAESPDDWLKFQEKAHGWNMVLVHCGADGKEDFSGLCAHEAVATNDWTLFINEYQADAQDPPREPALAKTLAEARSKVAATIPETVVPLQPAMTQGFINMAVQSKLQPIILFGAKPDPPLMLQSVAAALQGVALVGYRANPSPQDLEQEFGIPASSAALPLLVGMVMERGEQPEEVRMMVSIYDKMRFGRFSYTSILNFALQLATSIPELAESTRDWLVSHGASIGVVINEEADAAANGSSQSETADDPSMRFDDASKPLPEVASQSDWDSLCGDSTAQLMCVIGFFDGDPLNTDLDGHKATLQAIRETALTRPSAQSKLRFMWVDATCREAFASAMQVDPSALPSLVVLHPRKNVAFKMFAGLTTEHADKFLTSIVTGFGKSPLTLSSRPTFDDSIVCDELPSRAAIEEDIDEDEDDWLAEIRAEEERERLEKEAEAKAEVERLKAEEAKQQDSGSRRRRRRRRRRKAAPKDEL